MPGDRPPERPRRGVGLMHVTVAIPTYNRADRLRHALTSLTRVHPPHDCTWDLLVVDNGSTAATTEVLQAFSGLLPLQCIHEPRPGVARARNAAMDTARGDYMLCIDDDVSVDPSWIVEYVAAFRAHPEAALFGGRIDAEFESMPPAWLLDILPRVAATYGLRDLGASGLPLSPVVLPFGSNYAIRTAVLRQYRYDLRFGHHGEAQMLGEETQLFRSILSDGHAGWWVPAARVRHFIPRSRQTWTHLAERWYLAGMATAMQAAPDAAPTFLQRPVWLWKLALRRQARFWLRRLGHSNVQLVDELRDVRSAWGALEGYRRRSSGALVASATDAAPRP